MILHSNLPRLREAALASARVLDIGGWFRPFTLATHMLDVLPYETRRTSEPLTPGDPERFSAATWVLHDACVTPWPFPDGFFDFAVCSHLLEDVRDPLAVVRELARVSRAGYIETPSRLREIYCKQRFTRLRLAAGTLPEIGFAHHRWFVEATGSHLSFRAKTIELAMSPAYYLTRGTVGRKLTEAESGLGLFWQNGLTAEEAFHDPAADMRRFRAASLARLRG